MSDGIDALVHAVQPARSSAFRHRLAAQPEIDELTEGYNPVLPLGEMGDPGI
jgi:hypothetical protein